MRGSVLARMGEDDDLLFLSNDYAVTASLFAGETVFVTFQSATKTPGLHRLGFGEEFFRKRQIAAIHVVPSQSGWYQSRELLKICARVKKAAGPYKRVITYGSSMGGYAAINFAQLVGATDVIAISPQYTIDPARALRETRYNAAIDRMPDGFVYDQPTGRDWSKTRVNLIYDPFDPLDAYQADLAAQHIPVVRVRLNHSTHPVTAVLSVESLKNFILSYPASPDKAIAALRLAYKRDRAGSWQYWMALARRYGGTSSRSLVAAQRAAELNPNHPHPHLLVGNILLNKKRYGDAIKAYNRSLAAARGSPEPYIGKAKAFIGLRMLDRAKMSLDEARRRNGKQPTISNLEKRIQKLSLAEDANR